MIYVSQPYSAKPAEYRNDLHRAVYETLEALSIPFVRVDTDDAITMEDCIAIDDFPHWLEQQEIETTK